MPLLFLSNMTKIRKRRIRKRKVDRTISKGKRKRRASLLLPPFGGEESPKVLF